MNTEVTFCEVHSVSIASNNVINNYLTEQQEMSPQWSPSGDILQLARHEKMMS